MSALQLAMCDRSRYSLDNIGKARKELIAAIREAMNELLVEAAKDIAESVSGKRTERFITAYLAKFDKTFNSE